MLVPYHQPVLTSKILEFIPAGDKLAAIDCTVSTGGHSEAILNYSPKDLRLFCIDIDRAALKSAEDRLQNFGNVVFRHASYTDLGSLTVDWSIDGFDFLLADFGQSSPQIDDEKRGFSFSKDGPLDMRYDVSNGITAEDIINDYTKVDLERLIRDVGEEKNAKRITNAITTGRPIKTTAKLSEVVSSVSADRFINKTLSRVFMALRVAVNDELSAIKSMLGVAQDVLNPGGRMVFLTYDSNQDVLVKNKFNSSIGRCICPPDLPVCSCDAKASIKILTRKVIRPDKSEIQKNPRSRSCKLRAAEKL